MGLRPVMVNFKAVDHAALGRFWAAALGWTARTRLTTYVAPGVDLVWPDPVVLGLDFVAVPEAKPPVKNRLHLDLAHREDLVARLLDLGATPADVGQGDVPWTVLADPEGNEFCVLEPREIYRDTGPIAAVVVDSVEPRVMARFWSAAIDWPVHEAGDDFVSFRAGGPYLEFLRAGGAKTVPDRVHLDLLGTPADADRLRALGATDLDLGQGDVPWTVLTDPDGHEFCVLVD